MASNQGVEPGTNSRTSCAQRQATAILPAHSSASSRDGTSTTENPPIDALLSGCGPSVTVPSVETTLQVAANHRDGGARAEPIRVYDKNRPF